MVAAIVKIRGVPFCRPCRENYADEPEVLAKVIEWHESHPVPKDREMERIPRFGETELSIFSEPPVPTVVNRCICGCGAQVEKSGMLVEGHQVKVIPAPLVEEVRKRDPISIYRSRPLRIMDPDKIMNHALPEPEIADTLDKVLSEAGPRSEEAEEQPVSEVKGDPLDGVLTDFSKALKLYGDGQTTKQIAEALNVPRWRLQQSKVWTTAKREYDATHESAEESTAKKPRAKKDKVEPQALVAQPERLAVLALPAAVEGIAAIPPRPNKIRFVLFEADVDAGNLSQLTDAISKALGVPRQ